MDYVPLLRPSRLPAWRSKADFFKPFRSSTGEPGENIAPLYDPSVSQQEEEEPDLAELNTSLAALVELFPDVQPEVFREMLLSISKESRLQVVTEQLLKKKANFANGRLRPARRGEATITPAQMRKVETDEQALPPEDMFRGEGYRKAVKQLLYQEFRNLSHSTIRGVMAEHNDSYTLSRPTLQQLAAKSWRFSLSSLWGKRSPNGPSEDHAALHWHVESPGSDPVPSVKRTGSAVLDRELFQLFVEPILIKRKQDRFLADENLAKQLNEAQAEELGDVYDCECCYSSVPFEQIATCSDGSHYLCLDCISRTMNEAVYGQGWARSVDLERSTLCCFAPALQECQGTIPAVMVRRALNDDTWLAFQNRTTADVLTKSRVPLQKCPFCIYGEIDETPVPRLRAPRQIANHLSRRSSFGILILFFGIFLLACFFTLPIFLLAASLYLLAILFPPAARTLQDSWTRVHKQRRGLKFRCRNPSCGKTSCSRCLALWRDPHACFETERTSLRTAIEASATAAVKRTCPKCHLSFVKSSGCNKLVCNCGYAMCYICRAEITSKEGYTHFCQHFRPHGGRCSECERCDLYGDEDEGDAIRKAVEKAEEAWKAKEGLEMGGEGEAAAGAIVDELVGRRGKWWEDWLDSVLDAVVA